MKFSERLLKSKILVIGASYAPTDHSLRSQSNNNDVWTDKDEHYIGIAKDHSSEAYPSLVQFEDGNPFDTDWNKPDFLELLKNTLKTKKFEEIWIDKGNVRHFLGVLDDQIFEDFEVAEFAAFDPATVRQMSKNLEVLHYLVKNHTMDNCKFFMQMDKGCKFEEQEDLSFLEACEKRKKDPSYKDRMLSVTNQSYHVITQALKENLDLTQTVIEEFRGIKFRGFKVTKPQNVPVMQTIDAIGNYNNEIPNDPGFIDERHQGLILHGLMNHQHDLRVQQDKDAQLTRQLGEDERLAIELQTMLDLEEESDNLANQYAIRRVFEELNPGMRFPR